MAGKMKAYSKSKLGLLFKGLGSLLIISGVYFLFHEYPSWGVWCLVAAVACKFLGMLFENLKVGRYNRQLAKWKEEKAAQEKQEESKA